MSQIVCANFFYGGVYHSIPVQLGDKYLSLCNQIKDYVGKSPDFFFHHNGSSPAFYVDQALRLEALYRKNSPNLTEELDMTLGKKYIAVLDACHRIDITIGHNTPSEKIGEALKIYVVMPFDYFNNKILTIEKMHVLVPTYAKKVEEFKWQIENILERSCKFSSRGHEISPDVPFSVEAFKECSVTTCGPLYKRAETV